MILVDTSVWIEHLRRGMPPLAALLDEDKVLAHPFVIGELALGNLADRENILRSLHQLPSAIVAKESEVLALIGNARLFGRGIGYIDAHLLASTLLSEARLWTLDKRLHTIATGLAIARKQGQ